MKILLILLLIVLAGCGKCDEHPDKYQYQISVKYKTGFRDTMLYYCNETDFYLGRKGVLRTGYDRAVARDVASFSIMQRTKLPE